MASNLDMECARLGSQLATQSDDKTLTDALSVLEEQGVYAFFLYLSQKNDRRQVVDSAAQVIAAGAAPISQKNDRPQVVDLCRNFLKDHLPGGFGANNDDAFKATQGIAGDIDKLLLARDLLRQSLIYGRYHAKARASSGGNQ